MSTPHALPLAGPSPVEALPDLAQRHGLSWLGVKRDDLLSPLFGGTKVRKLDRLLALPPWSQARRLIAAGGIGSGQLACLAAAAEQQGRFLVAHCAWQEPGPHVLENLAYLATRAELHYHRGRLSMALAHPWLLGGGAHGPDAVVPAGATGVPGMLGLVDAGLELGAQVQAGLLPEPDLVVVPLGSGGTAVGLAAGLALAGLRCTVLAVAVVEWALSTPWRLRTLARALSAAMPGAPPPRPLRVSRRQLGRGYGQATEAGERAADLLANEGPRLDPVYGGKAFAALLEEAPQGSRVLFWHTVRRGPLPVDPAWREHLPPALRHRLDAHDRGRVGNSSRRWLLGAGLATAAAGLLVARSQGYDRYPQWRGQVLLAWQAEVLRAVAEAVLPPAPLDELRLDALPARTDAFLVAMSPEARLELHGLFVLVEQATAIGGDPSRFTRLDPEARLHFLERLEGLGGLMAVAVRGIRDLAMLGYYQDPATWADLAYEGPWVRGPRRPSPYEALRAPPGATP